MGKESGGLPNLNHIDIDPGGGERSLPIATHEDARRANDGPMATAALEGPSDQSVSNPSLTPFYPRNPSHQLPPPQDPVSSRDATGLSTILAQDDRSRVATYLGMGPKSRITDPYLYNRGVTAHCALYETAGKEEAFYSNYKKREPGFFRPGRVFLVLWVEPKGEAHAAINSVVVNDRVDPASQLAGSKELIYSRVRRFVVIRGGPSYCSALPIVTYGRKGVSGSGVNKTQHGIVYTSSTAPVPTDAELPGPHERPMQSLAIRVTPDEAGVDLDRMSRVDFGKIHTIHSRVKVAPFGQVHPDSMEALRTTFANVWDCLPDDTMTGPSRKTQGGMVGESQNVDHVMTPPQPPSLGTGGQKLDTPSTLLAPGKGASEITFRPMRESSTRGSSPEQPPRPVAKPRKPAQESRGSAHSPDALQAGARARSLERSISDRITRREANEYFWRRGTGLDRKPEPVPRETKYQRRPPRRISAHTVLQLNSQVTHGDMDSAKPTSSARISEATLQRVSSPAPAGLLDNEPSSSISSDGTMSANMSVHTVDSVMLVDDNSMTSDATGGSKEPQSALNVQLRHLVELCRELIEADDDIRAHLGPQTGTASVSPSSLHSEVSAKPLPLVNMYASQQARAEGVLMQIRRSLDRMSHPQAPEGNDATILSGVFPQTSSTADPVGYGVSGVEPSLTPDEKLSRYQHRLGDLNIFRDRLREVEIEYSDERTSREIKRDRFETIERTDEEFETTYKTRLRKVQEDLAAAEADLDVLRRECAVIGIDVEQRQTVSSSVRSASGDEWSENLSAEEYDIVGPAPSSSPQGPDDLPGQIAESALHTRRWVEGIAPDSLPKFDSASFDFSVSERNYDDQEAQFLENSSESRSELSAVETDHKDADFAGLDLFAHSSSTEEAFGPKSVDPALMYHHFAMQTPEFWKVGKVIEIVWLQPLGPSPKSVQRAVFFAGQMIVAKLRQLVVIDMQEKDCQTLRIRQSQRSSSDGREPYVCQFVTDPLPEGGTAEGLHPTGAKLTFQLRRGPLDTTDGSSKIWSLDLRKLYGPIPFHSQVRHIGQVAPEDLEELLKLHRACKYDR